jgi:hypothetical protein
MPQLFVNYIPLISNIISGFESLSNIGVQNLENFAETVSVSVPPAFSNLVSVSYKNVVLSPQQSLAISVLFNAPSTLAPGMYIIPINITTISGGRSTTQTEYVSQTIFPNITNQPVVLNQINLVNNTKAASGIIEVTSPPSENFSNLILTTVIPPEIASNLSDISTFGINATVKKIVNDGFEITWHLKELPAGSTVYGYFSIRNLSSQAQIQLRQIQDILVQPSTVVQSQVLNILNVQVPTMYPNSTGTVQVMAFYTGVQPGQVKFRLDGSTSATILNSTQTFNAIPNSYVYANFGVRPNVAGTLSLDLNASTQGISVHYPVIILVLQNAQQAQGNAIETSLIHSILNSNLIVDLLAIFISVLIVGLLYLLIVKPLRRRAEVGQTDAVEKDIVKKEAVEKRVVPKKEVQKSSSRRRGKSKRPNSLKDINDKLKGLYERE